MKNGIEEIGNTITSLQFDHVGLTYEEAGTESLTDIDFTAHAGETIGVIGGTGSGKSSLINLIPRFYDATAGAVRINGEDVKNYDKESLAPYGRRGTPESSAFQWNYRRQSPLG